MWGGYDITPEEWEKLIKPSSSPAPAGEDGPGNYEIIYHDGHVTWILKAEPKPKQT